MPARKVAPKKRTSHRLRRRSSTSAHRRRKVNRDNAVSGSEPLRTLNEINWDVREFPEKAQFKGRPVTQNFLHISTGRETMRLLLPITRSWGDPSAADGSEMVAYTIQLRGLKGAGNEIRFGDILYRIMRFYTATPIVKDNELDLIVLANPTLQSKLVGEQNANKDFSTLRFMHFVQGRTQFRGLSYHGNNTYSLRLG